MTTRRGLVLGAASASLLSAFSIAQATTPKSGVFTSEKRAYLTHSYWIEGADGLILIDTQFLPSDAIKFVELAERSTGKKAKLAVVLHPNPDKFNGTAVLQARGIDVVTSRQVFDLIDKVHAIRLGWFYNDYKPDYPKDAPKPSIFGDKSTALQVAGLSLKLHVLGGAGCSDAHVVAQAGDAFFVGDLLASQGHAWMELALFDEWLKRLDELRAFSPAQIYVGRGKTPVNGLELIEKNRYYLQTVRSIVKAEAPSGELGFFRRRSLKAKIEAAFPGYEWDAFVHESLPEIWKSLAK